MEMIGATGIIQVRNWQGRPRKGGGYWIHAPNGDFRGFCPENQIEEYLKEISGENYRALPAITRDQIRMEVGERTKGFAGQWCQRTSYYLDDKLLGLVQTHKRYYGRIGSRIETISCAKLACVMGSDLRWICEQNGLRLEKECLAPLVK